MSTLRKRGKSWFLDLRVGDQRFRESLKTGDRHVAMIKAKIRERELRGVDYSKPITIEDFAEEYLTWSATRKTKGTVQGEKSCIERLKKTLEVQRLDKITAKHADWFIAEIAKKRAPAHGSKKKSDRPMSPSGVNNYIRTLRSIFSTAVKWKYMTENPFKQVKLLGVELDLPRVLSQREIASLIMTARHHYPYLVDLFHFYLLTGLRRSEALTLRWEDIDFEKNIIIARNTKAKRVRIVPILPKAREILQRRRAEPRPFAFVAHSVTEKFTTIAKKAGISASLHDLRRTFASNLLTAGVPKEVVQKLVGHADFATTDTFYFSLSEDVLRTLSQIDLTPSPN